MSQNSKLNRSDWKYNIEYPYKGHVLSNPEYIRDRDETFNKNGNGWWWGRGWWNGHTETPMQRQQRYRKEKERSV